MIYLRGFTEKDFTLVFKTENDVFNQMTESEFRSQYIDDPLISIHMISDSHTVVGYIVIWLDGDKSQIYSMVIFDGFRRQGIAYTAMMIMEIMLKQKGVHEWTLEVRESNTQALGLYRKVGFRKAALRRAYYKNHEDALLMVKII